MIRADKIIRGSHGLGTPRWFTTGKDTVMPHIKILLIIGTLVVLASFGGFFAHRSSVQSRTADEKTTATSQSLSNDMSTKQQAASEGSTPESTVPATQSPADPSTNQSAPSVGDTGPTASQHAVTPLLATVCDTAARTLAATKQKLALTSENTYHETQLGLIATTHALDRLLHPDTYQALIAKENTRHDAAVKAINDTYLKAINRAHCS